MDRLGTEQLKAALSAACDGIIANEGLLTRLDTAIGDGDHGVTMKVGFTALKEMLAASDIGSVPDLFRSTGLLLVREMGGAAGVLFGTMFIGGHEALVTRDSVSGAELARFFRGSCDSIARRGRTSPGDKTMLDALCPAAEAMERAAESGEEIESVLLAAKNGAAEGVRNTEKMLPRKGRSKNFRDVGIDLPDPGAVSVSIIFASISDYLQSCDCRQGT